MDNRTKKISDHVIDSLLDRLQNYFQEINDDSGIVADGAFKFKSIMLIAEVLDLAMHMSINRMQRIKQYFGTSTIKTSLQRVQRMEKIILTSQILSEYNDESYNVENNSAYYKDVEVFAKQGADALIGLKDQKHKLPSVLDADLWFRGANYRNVFYKAQEKLDDDNEEVLLEEKSLSIEVPRLSDCIAIAPKNIEYVEKLTGKVGIIDVILDSQKQANDTTFKDLHYHWENALEALRQAFMMEAMDIYFVRSGNFKKFNDSVSQEDCQYCYTELPIQQYNIIRKDFREEFNEQLNEISLDTWRLKNKCIGHKLTSKEYERFLKETREIILQTMQSKYPDLWQLREHSGGLDVEVTPINFARMFYCRADVDRNFLELQWELELLNELIADKKKEITQPQLTPEEQAVDTFVNKLQQLAIQLFDKWNGKRMQVMVHQPEELIEIKKDEILGFLNEQKETNYEHLLELCYPQTSQSKSVFCSYVVELRAKGFFGKLPKKYLAKTLAPIVGLSVGATTNYLS